MVLLGYQLSGFHGGLLVTHARRCNNGDPERVHKEGGKEVHAGNIVAAAIDAEQVNGAA